MEIASKYNPAEVEDKWYKYWLDHGFFKSSPDNNKEPYTIVIPPPNVTGVLHMGHMLNNTIQDILIRRARMKGKNALWVPGTDHASIATEAKVVAKLKTEGIEKRDISRQEFLKHAWEWTDKHGGIILEQLKKLGASCDWDRTCFTMDDERYESVIDVFIDLYRKDKIYRGVRMVNWDPQAQTAVSDEEVLYKEEKSKLYYVRYFFDGETSDGLTIATTRPETILGDTAVCVNPEDKRFTDDIGKHVIVPLVNRKVKVIADDYVDKEFGTGCLKITPAHDENDYEIGIRHNLEVIDIFDDNGALNEKAEVFIGTDRFEARKLVVKELEKTGQLLKIEDYTNKVGYSERTDAVIEPKLSMQWFLKMKELSEPALTNVLNDNVKLHPAKFKNTYRHWMENVKDWCISRQLWWGHRIPAYYINSTNEFVVAKTAEEALALAIEKTGNKQLTKDHLHQDEDVLDTWFSSWLWPVSVFDGIRKPDNPDITYYYPTSDLITAPDILFFWVARMIIAGYEYRNEKPFGNVYLTGMVRDNKRRKMSKSLGNSPDPIQLMEKYSADGVRVGMLLCSPAGNDLLFDESLPEQGRNFANKIWNAFRLVIGWKIDDSLEQPEVCQRAIEWFENKLHKTIHEIDDHFSKYRLSDALMSVYRLFWDDFSSWYLESIKPAYQKPIDAITHVASIGFLDKLMRLLHPFMPFITEEIWQFLKVRNEDESIMVTEMPDIKQIDKSILATFEKTKEVIAFIRNTRKEKQFPVKKLLELSIRSKNYNSMFDSVISKLGNLGHIQHVDEKQENSVTLITKDSEYYLHVGDLIDHAEEIRKLQEELEYTKGFLQSVLKKLNNDKFVNNAPSKVVEMEKRKYTDAEAKIKALEAQIKNIKK